MNALGLRSKQEQKYSTNVIFSKATPVQRIWLPLVDNEGKIV